MAEILLCEYAELELIGWRGFPQEVHIDSGGGLLGLCQEFRQAGLGEAQHHIGGFDLAAFAVGILDLQRRGVVRKYVADLETAVFFVKDVHGRVLEKLRQIITCVPVAELPS